MSCWSLAGRRRRELQHRLLRAPRWRSLHVEAARVAQVLGEPVARTARLIASTQISARPLPPAVRSCRPLDRTREDAVVHVPDGERQRRQRLEVVLGEELLAVAEVDRLAAAQPARAAGVKSANTAPLALVRREHGDVAEQRRLPVEVVGLLGAVAPTGTAPRGPAGSARGRRRPSGHRARTCHCWSLSRCGLGLHHPVAGDQLAGLAPSARRPDQVVGGRGELRAAVAAATAPR